MKTNIVYLGNCLDVLPTLPSNSVDSIVTDPPYELGFMGKSWDNSGIAYNVEMWKECLRVLKPGGHLLSFSGTRTYHRMAVAIEDAGFEVRDMIEWVYGSGFPKSLNIGKAVDKLQGNKRIVVGEREVLDIRNGHGREYGSAMFAGEATGKIIHQDTKGTSEWEGWGTALKPAHEPICMARKPLEEKTVAENVLKYGTGGINIDESRVEATKEDMGDWDRFKGHQNSNTIRKNMVNDKTEDFKERVDNGINIQGRFPANLIHDNSEEVRECFPKSGGGKAKHNSEITRKGIAQDGSSFNAETCGFDVNKCQGMANFGDSGNASRFFKSILYYPKASKSERNKGMENLEAKPMYRADGSGQSLEIFGSTDGGRENRKNNHPTVKPIALMSYLIKMITPKCGIVLEPFAGSGSTLVAAKENGFQYIGIEMTEEYLPIIQARTGCEIIKPEKFVDVEETITNNVIVRSNTPPLEIRRKNYFTADIVYGLKDICECGGKIKKTASGRCCEWCLKDY